MIHNSGDMWRQRFKKRGEIVSRKIAGETILVPIRGRLADMQRIFSLNPVAECIWEQIDGQKKLGDIRNRVLCLFEVGKELADSDIEEFIAELLKEDLIVRVS